MKVNDPGPYKKNKIFFQIVVNIFNPLSANVVHAQHSANVSCNDCSTSYEQILLKEEKFATKWYTTLCVYVF